MENGTWEYVSFCLNALKRICRGVMGAVIGDTRSLDYSSFRGLRGNYPQ